MFTDMLLDSVEHVDESGSCFQDLSSAVYIWVRVGVTQWAICIDRQLTPVLIA